MTNPISSGYNNQTGRYERRLSNGLIEVRQFEARDPAGLVIGQFDSRDAAAGACQDAAREAGDDGEGYEVTEIYVQSA